MYAWLIEWLTVNLSYDVNSLFGAGYDWRLSMTALQDRDGYFTRLRKTIEGGVASNGGKAGIVGEKIKLHHNAATQRNATQHNATQHNATQHNTTQQLIQNHSQQQLPTRSGTLFFAVF